jgi:hypothetical protein
VIVRSIIHRSKNSCGCSQRLYIINQPIKRSEKIKRKR